MNDFKSLEETISGLNGTMKKSEVSRELQKYQCNAKSFDNAGFYPSMLSRLGANAIQALTHLFNGRLKTGSWVWRAAKKIFLGKESKTSYASAGAYRPISITPFIGKVLGKNNGTISQTPKSSQSLGQKIKGSPATETLSRIVTGYGIR